MSSTTTPFHRQLSLDTHYRCPVASNRPRDTPFPCAHQCWPLVECAGIAYRPSFSPPLSLLLCCIEIACVRSRPCLLCCPTPGPWPLSSSSAFAIGLSRDLSYPSVLPSPGRLRRRPLRPCHPPFQPPFPPAIIPLMPIATSTTVVPTHPSAVVKMEDRKRPAIADTEEYAPPSKRQAVNGSASRAKEDPNGDYKDEAWLEVRHHATPSTFLLTRLPLSPFDPWLTGPDTWSRDALRRRVRRREPWLCTHPSPRHHRTSRVPAECLLPLSSSRFAALRASPASAPAELLLTILSRTSKRMRSSVR